MKLHVSAEQVEFQGWDISAAAVPLSVSKQAKLKCQGPAPGSLQSLTNMSGEHRTKNPAGLQLLVIHFLLFSPLSQKFRRTDVAHTLWEKRWGFLSQQRRAGGNRCKVEEEKINMSF